MNLVQTHSGKKVNVHYPVADQICIEDIAHALAHICRFGGHAKFFYSVAQHAVEVSMVCPQDEALVGLLHDATEAYLGDLVKPVKNLCQDYQILEYRMWLVIAEHFNVGAHIPHGVKVADQRMLATERKQVFKHYVTWGVGMDEVEPYKDIKITSWGPRKAKAAFMAAYRRLSVK